MKFEEKVDKKALEYILRHYTEYDIWDKSDPPISDKTMLSLYNKYLNQLDDDGKIVIEYEQKEIGIGRMIPKSMGLTRMARTLRHTIANPYNLDFDIENCHPTIALKIATEYKLDCPCLEEYVSNRAQVIDQLIKETGMDDVKRYVIKLLNGGKHNINNPFLNDLCKEFEVIQNMVMRELPNVVENISNQTSKKDSWNLKGKVLHYLLETYENDCLSVMIKYFQGKNVNITSLAYDGLTIEGTKENKDNSPLFCNEISSSISQELKAKFKVVQKPMNQGFNLKDIDLETKASPISLLQARFKTVSRCACELKHNDYSRVIEYLVKTLKIKTSTDDNLINVMLFMTNVISENCFLTMIEKLKSILPIISDDVQSMAETMLSNPDNRDEEYGWTWAMSLVKPRAKTCSEVRRIIQQMLNVSNSLDLTKAEASSFKSEHRLFDMVKFFNHQIFPSKGEAIKEFVKVFDLYVKRITSPPCFVTNEGNDGSEIRKDILIETLYKFKHEGIEKQAPLTLITNIASHDSVITDINVYKYLPSYSKITFDPTYNHHPDDYNMYSGFQASKVLSVNEELIQPILDHIKNCWADGNDDINDYILQWFRQCFLYPGEKTGVAMFLFGEEGTGKNILIDNLIIPLIYGKGLACVSQGLGPLTQRFNSICMNKLLICCNEVSSEDGWSVTFDKLKAIITDITITIEKKGIDQFKDYPNLLNLILTSNHSNAIKLGTTDRRYLCLPTSNRFKGNFAYFEKLHESCTQTVADHFYTYICALPRTRNIKTIPMTSLKEDMAELAKPVVERYCDAIKEYEFTTEPVPELYVKSHSAFGPDPWDLYIKYHTLNKDGIPYIGARDLYAGFLKWCGETTEKKRTSTSFGRDVKNYLPLIKTMKGTFYQIGLF